MAPQPSETPQSKRLVSVDLRVLVVVLLVVIGAMLVIWKPWESKAGSDRTVTVTGEATVTAKPDEFVFYPSYTFKNADKAAALADLSKKSDEIVAKLKTLGVADKDVKTNSSGYDYPVYFDKDTQEATYTLQVTVTTRSLTLTQKVQDYLVTTSPTGNVSPQADFSDKKQKELESQARNAATKDARTKVDQMAKNVGFKVSKVKSVTDDQGFGGVIRPFMSGVAADANARSSLTVEPGENDLQYSVTVVYFIR